MTTPKPVETESRWDLPDDWKWMRAKEFARIVGGGTPKNASDPANFDPNGTPWVTPADLSGYTRSTIGAGRRSLSQIGVRNSSVRLLPRGSVLVSSRAPVGYCAVAENEVCTNQGFRSLLCQDFVDPFFIRYYVLYSRAYLEENASGTTFKELSGTALAELLFPIPSIETQRRIVARIDELFAELDDGEAALSRAQSELDTYRKTLLHAAVTGRLTAEWRDEAAGGSTSGQSDSAQKHPCTWTLEPLGQCCGVKSGYTFKSSDYVAIGVPLIRIGDVKPPQFGITSATVSLPSRYSTEYQAFTVSPGDILIALSGATTGKFGRYKGEPALLNQRVGQFKIRERLTPEYLEVWLAHKRPAILAAAYGGAQPNISPRALESMLISLPPLREQQIIVNMLSEKLGLINEWASDDLMIGATVAELRKSLLAPAFRGELIK